MKHRGQSRARKQASAVLALQMAMNTRAHAGEEAKTALAQSIQRAQKSKQGLAELERRRQVLVATRADLLARMYEPDNEGMLRIPLVDRCRIGIQYVDSCIEENDRLIADQQKVVNQAEHDMEQKRIELEEADRERALVEGQEELLLPDPRIRVHRATSDVADARAGRRGRSRALPIDSSSIP